MTCRNEVPSRSVVADLSKPQLNYFADVKPDLSKRSFLTQLWSIQGSCGPHVGVINYKCGFLL